MFRNYLHDAKDPSGKHSFEIHDVDVSIINGIRRTILTDIPIPGMVGEEESTIEVIKNNGPLHNEILSHRIGLIPINMSEDDIEEYIDNSIELELNVSNESNATLNVSSADIKGKKNGKELTKKDLDIMKEKQLLVILLYCVQGGSDDVTGWCGWLNKVVIAASLSVYTHERYQKKFNLSQVNNLIPYQFGRLFRW